MKKYASSLLVVFIAFSISFPDDWILTLLVHSLAGALCFVVGVNVGHELKRKKENQLESLE